ERDHGRSDVARLHGELRALKQDNALLEAQLRDVSRTMRKARLARTTLASRVRASVYTVTASLDEGSGFVAWVRGRNSYVITANHVVALSVHHGDRGVRVHRGTKIWLGRVVETDSDNDLALIRVP